MPFMSAFTLDLILIFWSHSRSGHSYKLGEPEVVCKERDVSRVSLGAPPQHCPTAARAQRTPARLPADKVLRLCWRLCPKARLGSGGAAAEPRARALRCRLQDQREAGHHAEPAAQNRVCCAPPASAHPPRTAAGAPPFLPLPLPLRGSPQPALPRPPARGRPISTALACAALRALHVRSAFALCICSAFALHLPMAARRR